MRKAHPEAIVPWGVIEKLISKISFTFIILAYYTRE